MSNLLRLILAVLLMLPAAFCAFGFWASFESGPPSQLIYRGAYAAVGLACLAAAGYLGVSAATRRDRPGPGL